MSDLSRRDTLRFLSLGAVAAWGLSKVGFAQGSPAVKPDPKPKSAKKAAE